MKFMRQYLLSLLLTFAMVGGAHAAADLGNTSVISPTDASNGSGTCPSWLGSAAPSTLDDAGRCLQGAIAREWENRSFAVTSTGSANAYVVTYTVAPADYRTGQVYSFITNFAVTGSATVNINTRGAKTIKKDVAGTLTALSASDIGSGQFVMLAYNGTDMIWVNKGQIGSELTTTSADAGAAAGPAVTLDRFSASPAASDTLGVLNFSGRDSGANLTEYASVYGKINDPTNGSEDGRLQVDTYVAGVQTSQIIFADGVYTAPATGGAQGTGSVNATAYYRNGVRLTESFCVAASDETSSLTTGTAKITFRMPYAFTVSAIRGSLSTVATGATLLTVDVNEAGTTIISTKLTFDASESTTTTAATPAVISDSSLADDAQMTIDIDAIGNTTPGKGLKVCLIGYQT